MTVIKVHQKSVYGNVLMYVTNAEQAHFVQLLTKKKTVDMADVKALRALGLQVEVRELVAEESR